MTENQLRARKAALSPSRHLPHIQCHNTVTWVAHPGKYLRLCPLLCKRYTQTKKNMAQMKEQIKAPKIKLCNEEIARLSDAEFKHW